MSEPTFDSAMSQVDEVGEQLAALRAGARSAGLDIAPQRRPGTNTGHGHVWKRPDGMSGRNEIMPDPGTAASAAPEDQNLSDDEWMIYKLLRRVAQHDVPLWDRVAKDIVALFDLPARDARVRAQVASEIAEEIEDEGFVGECSAVYDRCAAIAREHASRPIQDGEPHV